MKYDYLIVGAGFAGCVLAERIATQLNKKVLIVEKRNHIGGNCYDYLDRRNILVHKYGPHAFHTKSKEVWDYLSAFTNWFLYEHNVLAFIDGNTVPIPFNLNSIEQIFEPAQAEEYKKLLLDLYGMEKKIPILKLRETDNNKLKILADFIYYNVFYGYTTKQWGFAPEELDKSVTSRVPVFISRDNRYFQDPYQGVPSRGYTSLFKKLTSNSNIEIIYNKDYKNLSADIQFDKMIFTGQIDYFFDFIHGELPYRSLRFNYKTHKQKYFQECTQINYPNSNNYTRITEFKYFLNQKNDYTTIAYEYPQDYIHGKNDPYYPIPRKENDELYKKYLTDAKKIESTVIFVGRLAEYKYYNMDQIVNVSLNIFKNKISKA